MKRHLCLWCKTPFDGGPGYCSAECMEAGMARDRRVAPTCHCGLRPDGGIDYTCGRHA